MPPLQLRMNRADQSLRFPRFQNRAGLVLARGLPQLLADIRRRYGVDQLPFDSEREPFGGARFELELHARGVTHRSQQAHRLVAECVNGEAAHFAIFKIRQAVGRVEKQAARRRIQGNGNRIEREVAPVQVFHDGSPAYFRRVPGRA